MGTVPTPLDWIANDGQLATATMLEAGVGDVLSFLLDPPGAQVRRTTAQSIPNNTPTAIQFDAEDSDNDAMHSTVTNTSRLTCNTPGRYLCAGAIPYDAGTTGNRECRVAKNGVSTGVAGGRNIIPAPGGGGLLVVSPVIEVPLLAGDYVELYAVQSNGTSLTTTAINAVFPLFRARWCGP
jgi:hypothetical protein